MKKIIFNDSWQFTKDAIDATAADVTAKGSWEKLDLPHTWNGKDGQDGGGDYYRGTCYYAKCFNKADFNGDELYLELEGANSSATVYLNGKKLASHDGGYSTWRVNLTKDLADKNQLCIAVDNAANNRVYPQNADFTFYGGLYRNVSIIEAGSKRFDLDTWGSQGIKVTPTIKDNGPDADVAFESWFTNAAGCTVTYEVCDAEGKAVACAEATADNSKACVKLANVHKWHGRKDPYLYTVKATLCENGKVLDERTVHFGCRSFEIDPERGFILNGEEYPLRGVSRHQDRPDIGNALLPCHHEEDIDLIMEVGATTIRLAHYQHNQYFYDLCDKKGLVLWAEIPYISTHMPTGRQNTLDQMHELIIQNYNHPSIVVWGVSNEITMGGLSSDDLRENHVLLNDLCHRLDPTRLTTMAMVSMTKLDDPYITIPDTVSWNHYFGWYGGNTDMNGPALDQFHKMYPTLPVGMSEYGCEALNWHTSNPTQGDYTEEYQAYYHEELIKQLFTRKYLWATHVWNMFDFAADARAEGGENGMNHKGLVTFDRKYKKDAFYAYKAWLSDEKFVHLCGKRYVNRVEATTKVTVYSNLPEVTMYLNGKEFETQKSDNHFFYFMVPNAGTTTIKVCAGDCCDEGTINKVEKMDMSYVLQEQGDVINWFELDMPEGYLNINCTIGEIVDTPEGLKLMQGILGKMMPGGGDAMGHKMDITKDEGLGRMFRGFTLKRAIGMMKMTSAMNKKPGEKETAPAEDKPAVTKEQLLALNKALNQIKKVSK
ncbi:MAG: glycoside hydrolase family 2 protein [Treponemataceae bacterium]|nr:glycoside hydrolase family 2 protein [Treponemataceae bacterium]